MLRVIALSLPRFMARIPFDREAQAVTFSFAGSLQNDLRQRLPVHIAASN